MGKPSLQEIANMPLNAATGAVRRYYDPNWGTDKPSGAPVKWEVELRYYHSGYGTELFTVEAATCEEAEEKAAELFAKGYVDLRGSECEIEKIEVSA